MGYDVKLLLRGVHVKFRKNRAKVGGFLIWDLSLQPLGDFFVCYHVLGYVRGHIAGHVRIHVMYCKRIFFKYTLFK